MLRLLRPSVTPPGHFRYVDPNTGHVTRAPNLVQVVSAAIAHRKANKLEIPDHFAEVIQDWLCRQIPNGMCVDEHGRPSKGMYRRSAESSVRATMALSKLGKRLGHALVSQPAATSRAAVCIQCSLNVPLAGCLGCRGVKSILEELKRGKGTEHDSELLGCGITGALNPIQVYIGMNTLTEAFPNDLKRCPAECWMRGNTNQGAS